MSSFDTAAVLLGPIFLKQGSQFEGDYTLSSKKKKKKEQFKNVIYF